jgi:CDP-diacylglycerol--serine O-phosphatidyltransferase
LLNINRIKKAIPHAFTLGNLAFGFLAITYTFKQEYLLASLLIILASIFDIIDGHVARWLDVSSELGKQLDSLADATSFVIAPALMVYLKLLEGSNLGLFVGVVISICGILRLAKFNLLKPLPHFVGLPTPWFAVIVLVFVMGNIMIGQFTGAILFLILAGFMVSNVRLPNFK